MLWTRFGVWYNVLPLDLEVYENNDSSTSLTYEIIKENDSIKGYIDEINAIKQAIYKILMTEKGKFDIYDDDFGIKLDDIIGQDVHYAQSVLPMRIKEALLTDSRISDVYDFSFSYFNNNSIVSDKGSIIVKFFVASVFGELSQELEVNI